MEKKENIRNLIKEGRLPEAFSSFESFISNCEDARLELLQGQNQYFSLEKQIHARIVGDEAYMEQNRITLNFLNQLKKFHREVLSLYFDVADKEEYLKEITSRDQFIREILELRLQSKNYKWEEQLGEGNSSVIYRLLNPFTSRYAICMVMKLSDMTPVLKTQILQLAGLRHRNVIKLMDCELDVYPYFIIQEYIHGPTLQEAIEKTGPRPAAQAADWLYQLTDAVEYLRHKRLLPNNLRPSKIFIDDEWQVMISPFDLSMASAASQTFKRYLDVCRYGSPELLRADGKNMNLEQMGFSDQYAIGLIAYKILAGKDLFEGESVYDILESRKRFETDEAYRAARLDLMPVETFTRPDGESCTLVDVVGRLLREKPEDRFATLHGLLDALHMLTRAENPDISLARKSYRRCMAMNKEFIRDFYQAFHRHFPETEKEFSLISRNKQTAMLQMAVDILLDIEEKKDLLRSVINSPKHQKYEFLFFEAFLDTLLEALKNNDFQWDDATEAEWRLIRDKALKVIGERE